MILTSEILKVLIVLLSVLPLAVAALVSLLPIPRWRSSITVVSSLIALFSWMTMFFLPTTFPLTSVLVVPIYVDALSLVFGFLAAFTVAMASFFVSAFLADSTAQLPEPYLKERQSQRFYFFFNLFSATLLFVPLAGNLVGTWIALTLSTLTSMWLIGYKNDWASVRAMRNYLILTGAGLMLALIGLILLYVIPGNLDSTLNWSGLIRQAPGFDPVLIKMVFVLSLIGYGTKAGLVPLHWWLPDSHAEAPYPVSALLSGALLKAAIYAILRVDVLTNVALGGRVFSEPLWLAAGFVSLVFATVFLVGWNAMPFKRALAYSSIAHIGVIAIGLGVGNSVALAAVLFLIVTHALNKAMIFLVYGDMQRIFREVDRLIDLRGGMKALPLYGSLLALGGMGLVGTPPLGLFVAELLLIGGLITAVFSSASILFSVFTGLFLIVIFFGFFAIVIFLVRTLLDRPPQSLQSQTLSKIPPIHLIPLFASLLVLLWLGLALPLGFHDFNFIVHDSICLLEKGAMLCP